eukprot:GDKJ01013608.1.p1 GENE.GDKJ01013608.1~~GDKJ01013608.1.p1  ORF type:complete len:792 (+),score=124.89 GDKJ01013608.1:39-2414(+)
MDSNDRSNANRSLMHSAAMVRLENERKRAENPNYEVDRLVEEENLLMKQAQSSMNAAIVSAKERISGKIYTDRMKASWQPPFPYNRMSENEKKETRDKYLIEVQGNDCPPCIPSFSDMRLPRGILNELKKSKIDKPTAIQMQALPAAFSGRDLIGIAFTGSGKTLVFVLPAILLSFESELNLKYLPGEGPHSLIIAPSRELAHQTYCIAQGFAESLCSSWNKSEDLESSEDDSDGSRKSRRYYDDQRRRQRRQRRKESPSDSYSEDSDSSYSSDSYYRRKRSDGRKRRGHERDRRRHEKRRRDRYESEESDSYSQRRGRDRGREEKHSESKYGRDRRRDETRPSRREEEESCEKDLRERSRDTEFRKKYEETPRHKDGDSGKYEKRDGDDKSRHSKRRHLSESRSSSRESYDRKDRFESPPTKAKRELPSSTRNCTRRQLPPHNRREVQLNLCCAIGGTSTASQFEVIRRGVHVVVGTPGRIRDLVLSQKMSLAACMLLALDEADRLLGEEAFEESVRDICSQFDHQRQTLLISATMPEKVHEFAKHALVDPLVINVGRAGIASLNVLQEVEFFNPIDQNTCSSSSKLTKLLLCLRKTPPPVLIFCENRLDADLINEYLLLKGVSSTRIHSALPQNERLAAIQKFKRREADVLIGTDVASKGLDFSTTPIRHVINFEMPKEIENYVHRIGRTGRAGNLGVATTIVDRTSDVNALRDLRALLLESKQPVPKFLHDLAGIDAELALLDVGGVRGCRFCGALGHRIKDCPKMARNAVQNKPHYQPENSRSFDFD